MRLRSTGSVSSRIPDSSRSTVECPSQVTRSGKGSLTVGSHRGTVDAAGRGAQGGRHHSAHGTHYRRRLRRPACGSPRGLRAAPGGSRACPRTPPLRRSRPPRAGRAGSLTESRTTVGRGYAAVMRRAVSMPSMPPMVTSSSTREGSRSSMAEQRLLAGGGLSDRHEPRSGRDHGARRPPERGAVVHDQDADRSGLESGFSAPCCAWLLLPPSSRQTDRIGAVRGGSQRTRRRGNGAGRCRAGGGHL